MHIFLIVSSKIFIYYIYGCFIFGSHFRWFLRDTSRLHQLCAVGLLGHLVVNFAFSSLLLTVAKTNYPGGAAMLKLHSLERNEVNVNVHIDVLTAQTGVSRFTEMKSHWR